MVLIDLTTRKPVVISMETLDRIKACAMNPSVIIWGTVRRLPSRLLNSMTILVALLQVQLNPADASGNGSSKANGAGQSSQRGTILRARNGFGQENTYINDTGIRIEYPVAGLNLICKKPSYEIVWFNPQAKTVMKETISEFRMRTGQPLKERDMSVMPQTPVKFAGVLATQISLKPMSESNKIMLPEFSTKTTSKVTKSNYYVLKNVSPDAVLTKFLNTFFHFPASGGVPIGLTHNRSDGTISTDFAVQSVEHNAVFPPGVFDPPVGYKPVFTQPDVAQGPGYKKQFDDLARDMGLGVPLGK
ncbi:MAG TPA: hypothetical protein V6C89_16065 [Drouetiella sp.]|jgi:hypothetical protein